MPSSQETVVNKALSGAELADIIRADCERLIKAEGLLSSHIAFGRVAYDITMRIHTGNMQYPVSPTSMKSKAVRDDAGELGVIESLPLTPPPDDQSIGAQTLTRTITSPNEERLRHGFPVPVRHRNQDGSSSEDKIIYPLDQFPEVDPDGAVQIEDTTQQARVDLGVLDVPLDLAPPPESESPT